MPGDEMGKTGNSTEQTDVTNNKKSSTTRTIVIIVIICLFYLYSSLKNATPSTSSAVTALDAKICAVEAIEDRLKSPSTAEFCEYDDMTAKSGGMGTWTVSGYVDAQNSFGATLREYFTVELTVKPDGDGGLRYSVQSVALG